MSRYPCLATAAQPRVGGLVQAVMRLTAALFGLMLGLLLCANSAAAQEPDFGENAISGGVHQPGWRVAAVRLGANEGFDRLVLELLPPKKRKTSALTPGHFWVEQQGRDVRVELDGFRWDKPQAIKALQTQLQPAHWQRLRLHWVQALSPSHDAHGVRLRLKQPQAGQYRAFVLEAPLRLVVDLRPRPAG